MRKFWSLGLAMALVACFGPARLDTTAQVDGYVAQGRLAEACAGLKSVEDEVRAHTARRLGEYPDDKAASACVADAVYDADRGTWDEVVASALSGTRHEAATRALGEALSDARVGDPERVVGAIGAITAPSGASLLEGILTATGSSTQLRAAAVQALRPYVAATGQILATLQEAEEPALRVAAANAMEGRREKEVARGLLSALRTDPDASVRRAVVAAIGGEPTAEQARGLCAVMREDVDPGVRSAAVRAFRGTTKASRAACLAKVVQAGDDDGSVREAVLDAIKRSPAPVAAQALCEEIGPWLVKYGQEGIVYEVAGGDIVEAQNFRDHERSYACVEQAMKQRGLSCYARNYLAHWMNDLGGKASPPHCPGMTKTP